MRFLFIMAWLWVGCIAGVAEDPLSFSKDIAPILLQRCVQCHGEEKDKGGYRLHSHFQMFQHGKSGQPPVVPGRPEQSLIYQLITTANPEEKMPQKGEPLDSQQVLKIKRWIELGALSDVKDPKQPLAQMVVYKSTNQPPAGYQRPIPIQAVSFSRDGQLLYVAGYLEVLVWKIADRQLVQRIESLPERISSLQLHPSEPKLLYSGGSPGRHGEAGWIDLTNRTVQRFATFPEMVLTAEWNRDGSLIALGSTDGVLRVYDGPSGQLRFSQPQHADWITEVSFSSDQQWLATSSRDRTARVFKLSSRELESTYVNHESAVWSVLFFPDSSTLATAGADRKVHLWKLGGAQSQGSLEPKGDVVRMVGSSKHFLTASRDGEVQQYQWKEKKPTRSLAKLGEPISALALQGEGPWAAAGTQSGRVVLFNLEDGKETASFLALPKP